MVAALAVAVSFPAPATAKRAGCKTNACHARVMVKHKQRVVAPYRLKLLRMAQCESTGNWHIATGNGYFGGLQFDLATWRGVGGRGFPHQASPLEQMYRAVLLIRRRGFAPWPVCGRR